MTVVGFAASWLKAVFFADNLALNAFFFFLGKWVYRRHIFGRRAAGSAGSSCRSSFCSGLRSRPRLTAVAGVLLLMLVMRPRWNLRAHELSSE